MLYPGQIQHIYPLVKNNIMIRLGVFMKRVNFYFGLLLIFSLSGALSAQTAHEIIAKNIETRGGIQKLTSIKTLKYTGTFKQKGIEANLTMYFKSPNKICLDLEVGEVEAKIGYDGKTLWKQNPGGTPRQRPKSSDKLVVAFAEYHAFLFAYREKGYEFELVGKENFEGAEVYKVKVTPKDGDIIYLLIDRENYVVLSFFLETPGGTKDAFYFRDFKETGGILLPHSMEARKSNGEITNVKFEKIESNVEIDETIFSLPVSRSGKKAQSEEKDRTLFEYSYRIPEQVDDGWITASLTDVGMKNEPLVDLMKNLLNRNDHYIHSILIIKMANLFLKNTSTAVTSLLIRKQ